MFIVKTAVQYTRVLQCLHFLHPERDKEATKLKSSGSTTYRKGDSSDEYVTASSRIWRLDMTPKRFRSLLWATEHIVKNVHIRSKWQQIARWLDLAYDEYNDLNNADIPFDERFYKVLVQPYI